MSRWEDAAFEQEHLLHNVDHYFGDLLDGYQEDAFDISPNEAKVLRGVHRQCIAGACRTACPRPGWSGPIVRP